MTLEEAFRLGWEAASKYREDVHADPTWDELMYNTELERWLGWNPTKW